MITLKFSAVNREASRNGDYLIRFPARYSLFPLIVSLDTSKDAVNALSISEVCRLCFRMPNKIKQHRYITFIL